MTHLWSGDDNRFAPSSHAEYLAHAIPAAQLHICSGGAYVIVDDMEEILQSMVGAVAD